MDIYNRPPQNIEAEQMVLGCAIIDLESRLAAVKSLSSDDFIKPQHKTIFDIIKNLQNIDAEVDMIIVNEKFDDINMLSDICSNVLTTAHADRHIDIVKKCSIRRSIIIAANKIINDAMDNDNDDMVELKSNALSELDIPVSDETESNYRVSDILPNVLDRMESMKSDGFVDVLKTGLTWVDKVLGGVKPEYGIIAARPSVGKSTLMINIMLNMVLQGKSVAMFNLEMSKEAIVQKMLSIISRVQNTSITSSWLLTDVDWQNISKNLYQIMDKDLYLFDDKYTVESVRYKCRELKRNGKLDFVCIDYLQLMDLKQRTNGRYEKITEISRQLKILQKSLGVPLWALSQLSRESDKEKNRKPRLSDLKESGAIEQDADMVMFLHNPNAGQYVDEKSQGPEFLNLILAKQRNGIAGVETTLKYYKNTQKMYDWKG